MDKDVSISTLLTAVKLAHGHGQSTVISHDVGGRERACRLVRIDVGTRLVEFLLQHVSPAPRCQRIQKRGIGGSLGIPYMTVLCRYRLGTITPYPRRCPFVLIVFLFFCVCPPASYPLFPYRRMVTTELSQLIKRKDDTEPSSTTTTTRDENHDGSHLTVCTSSSKRYIAFGIIGLLVSCAVGVFLSRRTSFHPGHIHDSDFHSFPRGFVWGAATSAYQIEGGTKEDGRGLSIWDTYCEIDETIVDGSSGDVACDHYHRVDDDVKLMKESGLKAYRFSISWPRIYPNGTGQLNQKGIDFYNHLIDTLLQHGIEPWVTLYHWDLPQTLEDEYGGWLSPGIVNDFGSYARTCFLHYGDRVKNWITINEGWTVAVQGYQDGTKAPGKTDNPSIDVYLAGHHLVLAHARAARIYKEEFVMKQHGTIGIANCGDFRYPKSPSSSDDGEAAHRAMIFQFAWFSDPFFFGDYPVEMREILKDRLPQFTEEQKNELIGATDFLGLNHYSTLYAALPEEHPTYGGYWSDMNVEFSSDPSWKKNFMGWSTNPDGCRELLLWLSKRYPGIPIFMTENGTAEEEYDLSTALIDEGRREYFEGYLRACAEAIELGVPLGGYFAWSLMDNFEWQYGYTRRFGICFVDFKTQVRTPKSSGIWYSKTIQANGQTILR